MNGGDGTSEENENVFADEVCAENTETEENDIPAETSAVFDEPSDEAVENTVGLGSDEEVASDIAIDTEA